MMFLKLKKNLFQKKNSLNFLTEFLRPRIISMDILIHFRENKKYYFLLTKDLQKQNLKRRWTSFEKK